MTLSHLVPFLLLCAGTPAPAAADAPADRIAAINHELLRARSTHSGAAAHALLVGAGNTAELIAERSALLAELMERDPMRAIALSLPD